MNKVPFSFLNVLNVSLLLGFSTCAQGQALEHWLELSLEELVNITVTAEKREKKVQETGIAVTALDHTWLDIWAIDDINRLGLLVPGMVVGRAGYDARPALRGVRTQQVEHNDSAISVYQNGIYRPRHAQSMQPIFDVARVEVMRGPQGTLFGRNSFGGTINTVIESPRLGETSLDSTVTGGDYGHGAARVALNVDLGETVALRFSGLREQHDAYIENTVNDDAGLRDKNTMLGRLQLLWQPTTELSLLFGAQSWDEDSNGSGVFGYKVIGIPFDTNTGLTDSSAPILARLGRQDSCGSNCGRYGAGLDLAATPGFDNAAIPLANPYQIASDYKPTQDLNDALWFSELNYDFDFAQFKVVASSTAFSDFRLQDTDFSHYSSVVDGYTLNSDTDTVEVQLVSNPDASFEWLMGLYYLREKLDYAFIWQDLIDLENNRPANVAPKNEWASWQSQLVMETHSKALFGQAAYNFNPNLKAVLGLRYTADKRQWSILGQNEDLSQLLFTEPIHNRVQDDWKSPTWKLGMEYFFGPQSFVYGSVSTGFLAGNFKNSDLSYDEQNVTAYEVGTKNKALDDKLRWNVVFYYNEYRDLLATDFEEKEATTIGVVSNSGGIQAYGAELELDWLIDRWQFSTRANWSKAQYTHFITSNPFQRGGETINGVNNLFQLKGDQVALAPTYTLSLLARYQFDMGAWGLISPSLLVYASGDYRTSDEPYAFAQQQAYLSADLGLNWLSVKKHWELQFSVLNATNEAVLLRATRYGGNVAAVEYGDPRIAKLSVHYHF